VEKYSTAGQSTSDSITRCYEFTLEAVLVQHLIAFFCEQRHLSQQYTQNTLLNFQGNNGYSSVQQCYVIPSLPILFRGGCFICWSLLEITVK